jgi:hypothetical protein
MSSTVYLYDMYLECIDIGYEQPREDNREQQDASIDDEVFQPKEGVLDEEEREFKVESRRAEDGNAVDQYSLILHPLL